LAARRGSRVVVAHGLLGLFSNFKLFMKIPNLPSTCLLAFTCLLQTRAGAGEYHVATTGNDKGPGSATAPFRTIQRAADAAQPGDVVTVHAGIYRERIDPPRGGTSDAARIVYQAAPGEKVEIRGSELVKGWQKVTDTVWKVSVPNSFFKGFNPFADRIKGDWFDRKGRDHHTGAVYVDGDWLKEAASLDAVMKAIPQDDYLFNVMSFKPEGSASSISAVSGTTRGPVQPTDVASGKCLAFIKPNSGATYENVDFGSTSKQITFEVSSGSRGGAIEVRLGSPDKPAIGKVLVGNSGGYETYETVSLPIAPVSGKQTVILTFLPETRASVRENWWFAQVDAENTTIHAQFPGMDLNQHEIEINARRAVFYPTRTGMNYITVRGFTMRHAATPWAPPTAEQVGLIGVNWSRGWIIENNTVSHSICTGITLGKHGDEFDNTSADSAEGYVETIKRATARGWTKENIGHHIVRNNTISHCEQAGIVGSLGAVFSTVTGNTLHHIHVRGLFGGAEQAAIKFHAAIDSTISNNLIYRTTRGLWLDWMAQGTRVSGNIFYKNGDDVFVEVNHGPFLINNNLLLSGKSLQDWSEGGAYVHNLFVGRVEIGLPQGRSTPYHKAHSTEVASIVSVAGGDDRFLNNLFVGVDSADKTKEKNACYGLANYDALPAPLITGGNVHWRHVAPYAKEEGLVSKQDHNPHFQIVFDGMTVKLRGDWDASIQNPSALPVTSERLGITLVSKQGYVNPDGSPLAVDKDFFGKPRDAKNPTPGPFERPGTGKLTIKLR